MLNSRSVAGLPKVTRRKCSAQHLSIKTIASVTWSWDLSGERIETSGLLGLPKTWGRRDNHKQPLLLHKSLIVAIKHDVATLAIGKCIKSSLEKNAILFRSPRTIYLLKATAPYELWRCCPRLGFNTAPPPTAIWRPCMQPAQCFDS